MQILFLNLSLSLYHYCSRKVVTPFPIIERWNEGQVLIYDNLRGHTWIPVEQLKATSSVWGFVFRRHDHQPYSFQPPQYKAIAPATLQCTKQPHRPKNQSQNLRIPSASVPDDIRFPACQERSGEIIILRTSQLKHWKVSQLTPHHQVRALTIQIPRNTLTLHTEGRVTNTGYPWLVTHPETNTLPPLCKMSRPAMVIAATMGYPWVGLVPPFPHTGTHPPHTVQNNDIAGGASEATVGYPQLA